ncbi:MAG: hypothetical protein ACLQFR_13275 [Streptosporangiaceae bacterium]
MMIRPPGRQAGTASVADPRAAGSRAAGSGTVGLRAASPRTVRTLALLAAAGLLMAGCGSLTAGSAPAGPGSAGTRTNATAGHGKGSAGSATAGSAQRAVKAAGRPVLCHDVMVPMSVRIVRIGGPVVVQPASGTGGAAGQGSGGISESVTVTDTVARSLAAQACALPVWPRGVRLCPPALQYRHYQLTFTIPGRVLPVVTVEAGGCPRVTGLGPVRWLSPRQSFLAELGRIATVRGQSQSGKLPLNGQPVHRLSAASPN